ncbi:MAG: hypothetical protein OXH97_04700 [Chloroflexota bacterium]|nr:hypothetical protein [Chloroflexota bacterium]
MLRVMADTTELEELIARLATIDYSQGSEQATREMAVNPVIGALGWDTFNPSEVAREYSVRGGRVDYCLRGRGRNLVLIEVKRAGTDLTEHQEQLLRYAFDEGVPLAALTDGLVWWLYLPMAGGSWEQRRFVDIDFREHDSSSAASSLGRFLDRDDSISGSAQEEAQREFESQERDRRVRAALQDAWQQVLGDPDGLLRDLLAETVQEISGHRPDEETITSFLIGVGGGGTEPTQPTQPLGRRKDSGQSVPESRPPRHTERADTPDPANYKGRRIAAFWLDDAKHEVRSWRDLLPRICARLVSEAGPLFARQISESNSASFVRSSAPDSADWIPIDNSGLYVYVNITADTAVERSRRVLQAVRGSDAGFRIELAGVSGRPSPPQRKAGLQDFTGRRPAAISLDGVRHEVTTWRSVLLTITSILAAQDETTFGERTREIRGSKRIYFSRRSADLSKPLAIENSDFFVEGQLSANDCVRLTKRVLIAVRGNDDGFHIELDE